MHSHRSNTKLLWFSSLLKNYWLYTMKIVLYNHILTFYYSNVNTVFIHSLCVHVHTSSTGVNIREVLIVEVWLIQLAKRLELHLSILEEIQFGEKSQTYKPELESTHEQTPKYLVPLLLLCLGVIMK